MSAAEKILMQELPISEIEKVVRMTLMGSSLKFKANKQKK